MTVEEAIKTSIDYETRVRGVYAEAVAAAPNDEGRRLFQLMADEEQHHLDYLAAKLEQWRAAGAVTAEGLKTSLPDKAAMEAGTESLRDKMGGRPGTVELQFLRKALAVEQETCDFYAQMVDELPGEAKALFRRFLEIEDGHLTLVQAQIDQALGTGYWFDVREFDLEG